MELRHLRYFVAIAEEGSFTRAAARLAIQQPPLSQQLRALERELGVDLFHRHARGVALTAAGAAFLADARAVIAGVQAAALRATRVAAGVEGSLTIGLATSAASHRIAPLVIAAFRKRHPAVDLAFVEGNAAELTEAVLGGRAHVALIRASVDRPPELHQERLLSEPLLAALPAAHPIALAARRRRTPGVALRALRDESFILVRRPGAPGMYGDLIAACREAGFEPRIAAEVGNMFINTTLVAAGLGVSVVPASMSGSHAEHVSYLSLRGAGGIAAPLTLVTHRRETNPVTRLFVALARELGLQTARKEA